MLAQRIARQSLRRLTAAEQLNATYRFASPAALLTSPLTTRIQNRRQVATQPISSAQATNEILAKQRLARPVAPHLAIYQPQITWYGSAFNRITGCALSGGFYVYGALYLIAPYLGWHVETQVLAASFAAWPVILQIAAKTSVGFFFTYHCMNGVRHLIWDTASMITNQKVIQSGWFVVGASALSALALAFL